jgi:hypothetical protein
MRMRVRGFYHFFPRGKASAFEQHCKVYVQKNSWGLENVWMLCEAAETWRTSGTPRPAPATFAFLPGHQVFAHKVLQGPFRNLNSGL